MSNQPSGATRTLFLVTFRIFRTFFNMLAPRGRLAALSSLRHTNLTRRIDPRHPGTVEILHPQKNMNSEFQNSDVFEQYPLKGGFP